MVRLGIASKYVQYLVIAAVLLPLIFIAEVVYVERQQASSAGRVQTEALANLRAEAAEVWLSSQASYIRGIVKLNTVTAGEPESMANDLRAFISAETGFFALGYAGKDGKVQVDTSGMIDRSIGYSNYFSEAAAGREYIGQAPGTEWQQGDSVTIVAMPVTVRGEITGVVYGVIRQETVKAMSTKLVPQIDFNKLMPDRWFAWLGGVYLLGVIPLLLLVHFLRRPQVQNVSMPVNVKQQQPEAIDKQPVPYQKQESAATQDDLIAALQQEIAIASKRPVLEETKEPVVDSPQSAASPGTTPAAVIDKALAVRAYKAAHPTPSQESAAAMTKPADNKQQPRPVILETPHSLEQAASREAIPAQPALDPLSGLYSLDEFKKIIAADNGQLDMMMVILSIDGMKVLNDFLSEKNGDAIIIATADIVKIVGSGCAAARFDGDKFILLLTGTSTDLLEDIKKDIKYYIDLHNLRNPELPLSITIGAAAAVPGEDWQAVWNKAERDMERHKAINRVEARKFIMWSIKRNRGRA